MPRFKISQLVPWLSFVVALCTTILFLFLKLSFVTYVTSLVHLPATLAYMYFHQRHGKKSHQKDTKPVYLNIKNLNEISEVLKLSGFSQTRWQELGLTLGLYEPTLDVIGTNSCDVCRRLRECLSKWLKRVDNVDSVGPPTWDTLADGLRRIDENAAAEKLPETRKTHQLLQKYRNKLLVRTYPIELLEEMQRELITFECIPVDNDSLIVNGSEIVKVLHKAAYQNHHVIRQFATVLSNSLDTPTKSLATDIKKDYDDAFPLKPTNIITENISPRINAVTVLNNNASSETTNKVVKIDLTPDFQTKIDEKRDDLGILISTIAPFIKAKIPSLEEFKTFLVLCRSELKTQISEAESFKDVLMIISESCSIINIVLLETIVKHYSVNEAKEYIREYKADMEKFCELNICNVQLKKCKDSLLICHTIQFVVTWKVNECTLNRIKETLSVAFKDLRKKVEVIQFNETRSITITCYAPHQLMHLLVLLAQESIEELIRMGLVQLTIGYYTVYNKDEEMSLRDRKAVDGKIPPEKSLPGHKKCDIEKPKEMDKTHEQKSDSETQHKPNQKLQQALTDEEVVAKDDTDSSLTDDELRGKLEATKKINRSMSLELERAKSLLKFQSKNDPNEADTEFENHLREEVEALKDKVAELRIELQESKETNFKLVKDNEDLQSRLKEFPEFENILKKVSKTIQETSKEASMSGNVTWFDDGIRMSSPSPQQSVEVISKLNYSRIIYERIVLTSSSPDSTLVLLSQLYLTGIKRLRVYDSPLNDECIYCICKCISNNQFSRVLFKSTSISSNGLKMLTDAIKTNSSLKVLYIWNEKISEEDTKQISQVIKANKTLQQISLYDCDITDNGVKILSKSLQFNDELSYLNLRCNPLTADGIYDLLDALTMNSSITALHLDDKHKSLCENNSKYIEVKNRLVFR